MTNLLQSIYDPSDLKKLRIEQLPQLCTELRQFIIDEVSENPGHLGASLGVVELTVALHYAYNTPYDRLVWDVGHQAYGHKILTRRRDQFHTNRKYRGISGFPSPKESEYDAFGVGHSSTSISAAVGMAEASRLKGEADRNVIAIIGDGALTGGMAFEALNHAGMTKPNVLVVLNDNNIAIDANVGAMHEYLMDITTSQAYNRLKDDVWNMLGRLRKFGPNTQGLIQKVERGIKNIILNESNMFQALGFRYFGPVDGHDVVHLTRLFNDMKQLPGPKLLHIKTKKGKGYSLAEENQTEWHAPGKFNKVTGEIIKDTKAKPPRYQDVFGHTLVELAEKNPCIVGITPAMASGSSLSIMMEAMPDRAFDVGIAEQHAVTFSAGLAKDGMLPFCNIYSTFMQRAYDQVIHDVALQNLNVVFCLDRAGLVGNDGATHHGVFDIPYMRAIPGVVVAAPMDEIELRHLMFTAQLPNKGVFVIRYPRGNGVHLNWQQPMQEVAVGTGRKMREGTDVAVLSLGPIGNDVSRIAEHLSTENISIAHYDMRFAKPLDYKLLHEVFKNYTKIVTIEEGTVVGGFGSAVLEFMADFGYQAQIKRMGVPDRFVEHGTTDDLKLECGFDSKCLLCTIKGLLGKEHSC